MSQNTAGREARSQIRVVREGVWVQGPCLRVERGRVGGWEVEGERSGGGKEEGWLRVETMVLGVWLWLWCG